MVKAILIHSLFSLTHFPFDSMKPLAQTHMSDDDWQTVLDRPLQPPLLRLHLQSSLILEHVIAVKMVKYIKTSV